MSAKFQTVFDLTKQTNNIHSDYWFISIFVTAGVFLAILAWLAMHFRWRRRWYHTMFSVAWCIFCVWFIVDDILNTAAIKNAVERGGLQTVEGCLDYFRPGTRQPTRAESDGELWSVGGLQFKYYAGEIRPAFHRVGDVRADSRVRVGYVDNPTRNRREIMKLEVAFHACPPARPVESGTRT